MIKFNELIECNDNDLCEDFAKTTDYTMPWVDKYRPKKISEILYQQDAVNMLNNVLKTGNLPHILFYGNPGSGKCLHPDTEIMMFDGTIKLAKNIKINDKLMGDDNKCRNVLSITSGYDMMYKIIYEDKFYIINSSHIISLKLVVQFIETKIDDNQTKLYWFMDNELMSHILNNNSKDEFKNNLINYIDKIGTICDINIEQYIKKSDIWKSAYKGYRYKGDEYDFDVVKLDYGDYCGFEIDGNKRFLLGDFTVTHNTSSILAVAMELFGPKKFNERVIELNASDERGINVVRNKILTIAKSAVGSDDPKYLCPPFKIIILDEADAMTTEAQSALKKPIEENSNITRFCFICNYIDQIIEPIRSRCVKFRFKPLDCESICNKLIDISVNEKMIINNDAIKLIATISNGDMRKAIMLLQNLNYLNKHIDVNDVYEISNIVPITEISRIINTCLSQDLMAIQAMANNIILKSFPLNQLLSQLTEYVVNSNLDDKAKSIICINISETQKKLNDGADEYLQLLNVLVYIKKN